MEIKVKISSIGKVLTLWVDPNYTIAFIIESIFYDMGLNEVEAWKLTWQGKEVGTIDHDKIIGEIGITEGEELELIKRVEAEKNHRRNFST